MVISHFAVSSFEVCNSLITNPIPTLNLSSLSFFVLQTRRIAYAHNVPMTTEKTTGLLPRLVKLDHTELKSIVFGATLKEAANDLCFPSNSVSHVTILKSVASRSCKQRANMIKQESIVVVILLLIHEPKDPPYCLTSQGEILMFQLT